jgi:hypothetical protein
MKLKFPVRDINRWAKAYSYSRGESDLEAMIPKVKRAGYLTKAQLRAVASWKSPRSAGRVKTNDEKYVREVTKFSLASPCDRASIQALTILDGVQWPTASVILHFFHKKRYPILDFRALWSVNQSVPQQYDYDLWIEYSEYSRKLAKQAGVKMRTLDRALWQYSKKNQK